MQEGDATMLQKHNLRHRHINNKKRKPVDVIHERMDEAYKILKTSLSDEKAKPSQSSLYGQLVAQTLETFNEVEKAIVMNEIDNLLFLATMRHMGQQPHTLHSSNTLQQYPYVHQPNAYAFSPPEFSSSSLAHSYSFHSSPRQNISLPVSNQDQTALSFTTMESAKTHNEQPTTVIPTPQFSPF